MATVPLPREVSMPKPSWRDRRRGDRQTAAAPATLWPMNGVSDSSANLPEAVIEQAVMLRDVSHEGLGMRGRLPLDLRTPYRIHCDDPSVYLRYNTLRIVSCRRDEDGMYDIGAELLAA